tara:strand:+ start:986 stop:1147 length:162 start_codon:yes stop_codon:yes gene_type:complete
MARREHGTGPLVQLTVMKHDALVGIVSIGDVVKSRIRETEREAGVLCKYVANG